MTLLHTTFELSVVADKLSTSGRRNRLVQKIYRYTQRVQGPYARVSQVLFRPVPGEFSIRAGSGTPPGNTTGTGNSSGGDGDEEGKRNKTENVESTTYYAVFTFAAFSPAETEAGDAKSLADEAAAAASDIMAADLGIATNVLLNATATGTPSTATTTATFPPQSSAHTTSRKRRVVAVVHLHVVAPMLRPELTVACSSTAVTFENSALPITLYGSIQSDAIDIGAAGSVRCTSRIPYDDKDLLCSCKTRRTSSLRFKEWFEHSAFSLYQDRGLK